MSDREILRAVASTAELCGGMRLSSEALEMFVLLLEEKYSKSQVLKALTRCMSEVKGHLSPSDVISRIDDGYPGAEEAWAELPKHEGDTAVWTEEMASSYATVSDLIAEGNFVAARMAFKESYQKLVADARVSGRPVKWTVSLGHDVNSRTPAVARSLQLGRIGREVAIRLCPELESRELPSLPAGDEMPREALVKLIRDARKKMELPPARSTFRQTRHKSILTGAADDAPRDIPEAENDGQVAEEGRLAAE
jgi:hypothetical protein